MHSKTRTLALAFAVLVTSTATKAQTLLGRSDSIYTWRGSLGAAGLLTVKNFNGPIDVRPSSGSQIELRAQKRTDRGRGDLQDVAFDVRNGSGGDVTICAVLRNNNPCEDRSRRDDDDYDRRDRYVTVAMTVLVPRGAHLKISTGNGALSLEGAGGDVQASTGNGKVHIQGTEGTLRVSTGNGDVDVRDAKASVRVSTGNGRISVNTSEGPVEAHTGNGEIDVTMSKLSARDDMTFSTGNGAIRLSLPAGYNGELDASTGSGDISSDFEIKVQGRMSPRRLQGTIGSGGARLRMSSGSGRLEIRKT